ncbi:DUF397 domain-containing protein [Actinomadura coerulea]|uniref:DUF397 domain-containing protein n=1 Tax=Actinomadura coerulea TaxID=46159 RepID=UPI0034468CCF
MRTAQPPHPDLPGAKWQKSSHSTGSQHEKEFCVEVAPVGDTGHAIRDSKDPQGAVLRLRPGDLKSLIARLK